MRKRKGAAVTSEEKQAVRLMTAKYEKYGYTFISLLRRFGQAPKDKDFKTVFKEINEEIKAELKEKQKNTL